MLRSGKKIRTLKLSKILLVLIKKRVYWYRIGNNTCYIPKVSKFYIEKGYLCQQPSKCHILVCQRIYVHHLNVHFRQENNEKGDPMELNFEGLEMMVK